MNTLKACPDCGNWMDILECYRNIDRNQVIVYYCISCDAVLYHVIEKEIIEGKTQR